MSELVSNECVKFFNSLKIMQTPGLSELNHKEP